MPVVSAPTIAELKKYDSATISNAVEEFNVRDRVEGYANLELKCQFPQYDPLVGFAVTALANSSTPGDTRPQRIGELFEVLESAPKPAVLIIQHVGVDRLKSCFIGDMFAMAVQKKFGVVGVVTDAGNRDRAGIIERAPGFQVFSPGWVVSHGHGAFIDFNVDVNIFGMKISPGDLLHGDESGLVSIPHKIADQLPEQAQAVRESEQDFFRFIDGNQFTMQELVQRATAH